jgi:hypothetical protein
VYSEFKWNPWKFTTANKHFWDDERNVVNYLKEIAAELNITKLNDWYEVFITN